ncbi:MAG: hypothetical protein HOL15_09450 [Nitrospinaceae bacterium]|jgi:hypothetical protein|nr:hypothetical protein [Nitrospina sp.]MBT5377025.1 hypothetical protein [Nitrospinaceae bacterium]MBT6345891.1 hypothetical protein [Nitrospina sp.]
MFYLFKNSATKLKNKGREGFFILLATLGVFVACQGAQEDGNPFGPSTSTVRIIPSTVNVAQAANVTFTTLGGTTPFSWTSANLTTGTIIADTGVFTAGAIAGSVTITVTDAVGDTATATAVVLPLALGFDVIAVTQAVAAAIDTVTTNASGSTTGQTATIANNNTGTTFTTPPTFTTTATTIVITAPATLPNGTQGDQVYTVSVTDNGNNNTGTFSYTLQNDGT